MLAKLRTFFFRMPLRKKLWFLLMWPLMGVCRAAILLLPFRFYRAVLGTSLGNTQLSVLVSDAQLRRAWQIGSAVELTARYTPWESKCLVQSIVCACWCRLYRVPYVVYLGVRKDEQAAMKAHAWTCVGKAVVAGREGHRAYTIVSTFAFKYSEAE
ncbi:MAG: lasso peptide biosynthesis B2 protein [Idiomarina sp.]|nr:lasso peptide biosynthesis B2 protein [Idiomarina sp.]